MDAELKKTGGFKSQGEFFVAARKYFSGIQDGRIDELQKAAMTEGSDSGGGVLVPEEWAKPIFTAALEGSIVRSRANIIPMKTDTLNIHTLVDSDRGSSVFGGVTLTWLAEGADMYATTVKPAIGNLKLTAKKGVATCFVSRELESDYDALGSFMTKAFGDAVRFYEDDRFIWGTGSGQPLGIMNAAALISVSRTNYTLVPDPIDVGEMASRLLPGSWKNAVWLMNQKMLYTWAAAVATSGANTTSAIDLSAMTILGRPIVVTEHALAPGGPGDFVLADFSQYVIGDRDLIISASRDATYSSNSYGWFQDQTCWKLVIRVDGQPMLPAAITPLRGGETLSSFVALTLSS
jgi:HK97 family phage major capsid protein